MVYGDVTREADEGLCEDDRQVNATRRAREFRPTRPHDHRTAHEPGRHSPVPGSAGGCLVVS
jgi:hypothetical protein